MTPRELLEQEAEEARAAGQCGEICGPDFCTKDAHHEWSGDEWHQGPHLRWRLAEDDEPWKA
jgi:hypothetical protein